MRWRGLIFLMVAAACGSTHSGSGFGDDTGEGDGGGGNGPNGTNPGSPTCVSSGGGASAVTTMGVKSSDACTILETSATVPGDGPTDSPNLWTGSLCSALCGSDSGQTYYCQLPAGYVAAYQKANPYGTPQPDSAVPPCPAVDEGEGGADALVVMKCWTQSAYEGLNGNNCSF